MVKFFLQRYFIFNKWKVIISLPPYYLQQKNQRNIVFNPKDAESYIYLAKIYQLDENESETKKNLDTALLLEPDNEEAMYMLIDIELERSNFSKVKELKNNFEIICSKLFEKKASIDERLKNFEKKDNS